MVFRLHTTDAGEWVCRETTYIIGSTTPGRPDAAVSAHCVDVNNAAADNVTSDGALKAE